MDLSRTEITSPVLTPALSAGEALEIRVSLARLIEERLGDREEAIAAWREILASTIGHWSYLSDAERTRVEAVTVDLRLCAEPPEGVAVVAGLGPRVDHLTRLAVARAEAAVVVHQHGEAAGAVSSAG